MERLNLFEYYNRHATNLINGATYNNEKGRKGDAFISYFKDGRDKDAHKDCLIHADPEFVTNTYGDPNVTKNKLAELKKGDFLIFYTLLEGNHGFDMAPGMYVIGYLEVDYSVLATDQRQYADLQKDFAQNFHIKHKEIFERDINTDKNKGLKLVKGTKNSKLLKYAYKISNEGIESKKNTAIHIISEDMQRIFGGFGGKVAIQKNPLRWIKDKELVDKTVYWLKGLE